MNCSEIDPRCVPGRQGRQCRGSRGPEPQDKNLDSLLRVWRSVWCLVGEYWDQSPGHWPQGGSAYSPPPALCTHQEAPSQHAIQACMLAGQQ